VNWALDQLLDLSQEDSLVLLGDDTALRSRQSCEYIALAILARPYLEKFFALGGPGGGTYGLDLSLDRFHNHN
jgi:hypothetical protein